MITRFNSENHVKNLPDAYAKTPESNNAKLLEVEKSETDRLRAEITAIYNSLDIDLATGNTLDLYGEMLGQSRGLATDEQYRILIKNKILRNLASSDHNSIVRNICMTFNCEPHEVLLSENGEPCAVALEGLPLAKLAESNIDINTAVAIVTSMLPAAVRITEIEFSGTFEFADTASVYDEGKGFANDAQTFGGTLGFVADSDSGMLPV